MCSKKPGSVSRISFSGNVYLRNINDYGTMNEFYPEYFRVNGPGVRTCFQPNHGRAKNDVRDQIDIHHGRGEKVAELQFARIDTDKHGYDYINIFIPNRL